jgi:hypothetical protein
MEIAGRLVWNDLAIAPSFCEKDDGARIANRTEPI